VRPQRYNNTKRQENIKPTHLFFLLIFLLTFLLSRPHAYTEKQSATANKGVQLKKVKYIIDQKESEINRKQLFDNVVKTFGNRASIQGVSIEVDKNDENKIIECLTHSGIKYKKAA